MFEDADYRVTEFKCESCGLLLAQVWPSNMLVCPNWGCDNDEPLFLVEPS